MVCRCFLQKIHNEKMVAANDRGEEDNAVVVEGGGGKKQCRRVVPGGKLAKNCRPIRSRQCYLKRIKRKLEERMRKEEGEEEATIMERKSTGKEEKMKNFQVLRGIAFALQSKPGQYQQFW